VHVHCGRAKAHLVITGLIPQLAGHTGLTGRGFSGSFELGFDCKFPREDAQHLIAHLDIFRLWVGHGLHLERAARPSQSQRNEELIPWRVAVYVIAGLYRDLNRGSGLPAAPDR